MPLRSALLVWAVAVTGLLPVCVYADDAAHDPPLEAASDAGQEPRSDPAAPPSSGGIEPERSPPGVSSKAHEADPGAQHSDIGFALGEPRDSALGLKLDHSNAVEPGWHFSGRVGPLRWLAPLDGEGETRVRFFGRVPGQPRMQGMGRFHLGVHYNF